MKQLEGLKVLDFTEKLTGNLATMFLASYGAEVIKVERPNTGDPVRKWEPIKNDTSVYFEYLNRGKKSIEIDINTADGIDTIKKLVKKCDILCESFPPGFMSSLGLDYENVKKINPQMIYASATYFGNTGPYKDKPATSTVAQSLGVCMDMTGNVGTYPIKPGPSLAEHYSAEYLATGIILALIHRKRLGEGQYLDVALLDSIYSVIEAAPAAYSMIEELQTRKGNFDPSCAPYDTFKTNDGFVAIGVATEGQWVKLCNALDLPELINDPRFNTNNGRCEDYPNKLRPILEAYTMERSKAEIEERCNGVGIPCGEVLDIEQIINHPQISSNNLLLEVNSKKIGKVKFPAIPILFDDQPNEFISKAPELGENTSEVLRDLD